MMRLTGRDNGERRSRIPRSRQLGAAVAVMAAAALFNPSAAAAKDEWTLGQPDFVVKIPKQDVPATGVLDYRFLDSDFVMPASEVQAIEDARFAQLAKAPRNMMADEPGFAGAPVPEGFP